MLGGPGSGKGTQAQYIAQHFNLPIISTGNILRQAIVKQDDLGIKAQAYLEKGELVPDRMMIQFIKKHLLEKDIAHGWILEGYPRTAFQAEELDFLLEDDLGQRINYAIYLQVSPETMVQRSLARGEVDDQQEIIEKRIELFHQRTTPLLEYYQYKHTLINISGEENPDVVFNHILEQFKF
jgi:adenylate kinase